MKRVLLAVAATALVAGCGAAPASLTAVSTSSHVQQAKNQQTASPKASPSPVPHRAVIAQQKANAKAMQKAAKPNHGAAKSAATEPVRHAGPVKRNGPKPKKVLSAAARKLTKSVRYTDGVAVSVRGISHTTSSGEGPGALPGLPVTVFKIRITNDSKHALNANQVVVSLTIKDGKVAARPIYYPGIADFFGSIAPRTSKTTSYAFTVPKANTDNVKLSVDFDAKHRPATFRGSAR